MKRQCPIPAPCFGEHDGIVGQSAEPGCQDLLGAHQGSRQFPGNCLKLELGPAAGEIDFLISKFMTVEPTKTRALKQWSIQLETSAEIIAKKIRFRFSQFKRRDIFDLGAAATLRPEALDVAFAANLDNLPRLRDRITTMQADYDRHVVDDMSPTAFGGDLIREAPLRCLGAIANFCCDKQPASQGQGSEGVEVASPPPFSISCAASHHRSFEVCSPSRVGVLACVSCAAWGRLAWIGSDLPRCRKRNGNWGSITKPINLLVFGASYGSLLATKILMAGHNVQLICLPAESRAVYDWVVKLCVTFRADNLVANAHNSS